MENVRVYDGALWCAKCDKCPVVDYDPQSKKVLIHDPHKPESGRMTMTVEEYNALIANAQPIA